MTLTRRRFQAMNRKQRESGEMPRIVRKVSLPLRLTVNARTKAPRRMMHRECAGADSLRPVDIACNARHHAQVPNEDSRIDAIPGENDVNCWLEKTR